jgi:hypothetical protein
MANKILNIPTVFIPSSVGNLLNCNITSLSGPVGYTQTQPYLIIKRIRVNNKTGSAVPVTLYKGGTGGAVAGTEYVFAGTSVPANSSLESFRQSRFDAADFLTGVAGSANALTIEIDAEEAIS